MNIEKIKNFSKDEQKTLEYFEMLRNEIIERDYKELDEGIDLVVGRKFASKIDLLLDLVIRLEEDRKNNNEMILLAQNEILNYMSGYEDGKKQIEKYEEYIKRLQKENELLRQQNISYKNNINELKKKYEGDN